MKHEIEGSEWTVDERLGVWSVQRLGWVVAEVSLTGYGWRVFRRPAEAIPAEVLELLPARAAECFTNGVLR